MARQRAGADPARLRGRRGRAVGDRRRRRGGLRPVRRTARRRRPAVASRAALQRRPRARGDRRADRRAGGSAGSGAHRRGRHAAVGRAQAALAAAARGPTVGAHAPRRGVVRLARRAACGGPVQRAELGTRERSLRPRHGGLRARSLRGRRRRVRPLRPHPRPRRRDRRRQPPCRGAHRAQGRHPRRGRAGRPRLLGVRRRSRAPWRPARQAGRIGRRAGLQRPSAAGRPALPRRAPLPRPVAAQRLHGERRLRRALVPARARGGRDPGPPSMRRPRRRPPAPTAS